MATSACRSRFLQKTLLVSNSAAALRGAEGSQAGLLKRVDQAGGQRGFGADDVKSILIVLGEFEQTLATSVGGMSTFSASVAVPALPGATNTRSTRGLLPIFHASACSRPPLPMTRTFMDDCSKNGGARSN